MRPTRHPWHHLRHHAQVPRGAHRVPEGAEAFLDGSIGQFLQRSEGVVPAWSWANALAHANGARLRLLASGEAAMLPRGLQWRKWRRAMVVMAQEILLITGGSADALRALQSEVLLPLEERMAFRGRPTPWTPEHLTTLVVGAAQMAQRASPRQTPRSAC